MREWLLRQLAVVFQRHGASSLESRVVLSPGRCVLPPSHTPIKGFKGRFQIGHLKSIPDWYIEEHLFASLCSGGIRLLDATSARAGVTTLDTNCTTPSLIPTVNGNTVPSFATHGQQSAAKGSSTTVSRSDIRLIQHLGWLIVGYFPIHVVPLAEHDCGRTRAGGKQMCCRV